LTSGPSTQTVSASTAMTSVNYLVSTNCTDTTTVSAKNLPPGVTMNYTSSSGAVVVSGTPSGAATGTYNYSILAMFAPTSDATASATISGAISIAAATASSTTASSCTISGTLTSGPQSQTVSISTAITNVVGTFTYTCSDTLSASATGLPTGVSMSFSNNVATISGTPTGTSSGTYNYTVSAVNSTGTASASYSGDITVLAAAASSTTASSSTAGTYSGVGGIVTTFGSAVPNGYLMAYSNGYLYAWSADNKIQKIPISTGAIESTIDVGGYGDGLTVDSNGNIYTHPSGVLRKTSLTGTASSSAVSTSTSVLAGGTQGYAEGTGADAQFQWSVCMIIGADGNIYSTDSGRVRKITPSGVVTTYFEDTNNESLRGIVFDSSGNLFMSTYSTSRILKLTPSGALSVFAGGSDGYLDGTGTSAKFYKPSKMVIDSNNNLYVADNYARIRKITPSGVVTTLAGPTSQQSNGSAETGNVNGTGPNARFDWNSSVSASLAIDSNNNLYVGERGRRIRKVTTN
ncbi:putative Ig domain-containing protein, partial [Flavobacteriaceae bacterium]|nr:putative Ig domain-containing protein [Flavobacteriaceae bacterium]